MRSTIDQQIQERTESFIAELREVVRRAALASVSDVFGTSSSAVRQATPPTKPSVAAATGGRVAKKRMGQKRDRGDLATLVERLGTFIKKTPGKRIEEIAKAMGMPTSDLKLPAKKLIDAKRVTKKGVKRATTYFAK